MKGVLIGFIVVLLISALLVGVWFLDSRKKAEEEDGVFSYRVTEEKNETLDVLITCNEDVMKDAPGAFAKNLGLQGIPLELPGGPLLISEISRKVKEGLTPELEKELTPLQRSTVEILKRYGPRRVVLVSHSECLAYDTVAAWHDALKQVRERQDADLRAAKAALETWLPKTEIRCYFAEREGDRIVFRPAEACNVKEQGKGR